MNDFLSRMIFVLANFIVLTFLIAFTIIIMVELGYLTADMAFVHERCK